MSLVLPDMLQCPYRGNTFSFLQHGFSHKLTLLSQCVWLACEMPTPVTNTQKMYISNTVDFFLKSYDNFRNVKLHLKANDNQPPKIIS